MRRRIWGGFSMNFKHILSILLILISCEKIYGNDGNVMLKRDLWYENLGDASNHRVSMSYHTIYRFYDKYDVTFHFYDYDVEKFCLSQDDMKNTVISFLKKHKSCDDLKSHNISLKYVDFDDVIPMRLNVREKK